MEGEMGDGPDFPARYEIVELRPEEVCSWVCRMSKPGFWVWGDCVGLADVSFREMCGHVEVVSRLVELIRSRSEER